MQLPNLMPCNWQKLAPNGAGVFIIAYDQNHGHCSNLKIQPNGAGGMAGKKKNAARQ